MLRSVYNPRMGKHVIHISEDEAATTNVATFLAHVHAGAGPEPGGTRGNPGTVHSLHRLFRLDATDIFLFSWASR